MRNLKTRPGFSGPEIMSGVITAGDEDDRRAREFSIRCELHLRDLRKHHSLLLEVLERFDPAEDAPLRVLPIRGVPIRPAS